MAKGSYVTKELVMKVKRFNEHVSGFTQKEIGEYCGASATVAGDIIRGKYDHLLQEPEQIHMKEVVSEPDPRIDKINAQLQEIVILGNGYTDQLEHILDILSVIEERLGVLIVNKKD